MAHNDQSPLLTQVYSTFLRTEELGLLTDATVAAADTRQGLKNAIDNVKVHNDQENWKIELKRAIDASGITDAQIAPLTTVAGLLALLDVPATTSQAVLA